MRRRSASRLLQAALLPAIAAALLVAAAAAPSAGGGAAPTGERLPPPDVPRAADAVPVAFAWRYDDRDWTWSFAVDRALLDAYATRDRLAWASDLDAFVTDPRDDALAAAMAASLAEAGRRAGYSPAETLALALAFVQSVSYAHDAESAGREDWPRYPPETLVEPSDCEDTAALFASLAVALGYDAVLLVLPGHVVAAVSGPDLVGEAVSWAGRDWRFAETTGEGWGVGEIPTEHRGAPLRVVDLRPRALLAEPEWRVARASDRLVVTVEVANPGAVEARGAVVHVAVEPGDALAWTPAACDADAIPPLGVARCTAVLPAPPVGTASRLRALVGASNAEPRYAHTAWAAA